jgi:hypothetical protein
MARGDKTAQTGETQALQNSNTLASRGSGIFNTLAPSLTADMAHPAGYNPSQLASMNTAAQQSAGGSQAAATGQGGLLAARTNNAGAAQGAIADSARSASNGLSGAALQISGQNADLQQHQKDAAQKELAGLYGTNEGQSTANLGEIGNLANANTNASNASWNWMKYGIDPLLQSATTLAAKRLGP